MHFAMEIKLTEIFQAFQVLTNGIFLTKMSQKRSEGDSFIKTKISRETEWHNRIRNG